MVVMSGNGPHEYYLGLSREEFDIPLEHFSALQESLAHKLGTDPKVIGLPRVLRLPGTLHLKDPSNPKLVTLVTTNGPRYTYAGLVSKLGLSTEKKERAAKKRKDDLVIPPDELKHLQELFGPTIPLTVGMEASIEELLAAAKAIHPSKFTQENDWMNLARAFAWEARIYPERTELLYGILDLCSQRAPGYDKEENRIRFDRYIEEAGDKEEPITIQTVFYLALESNWNGKILSASDNVNTPPLLPFINFANWDHEPVPKYEWCVPDRYPLRQTILFTGEGAIGKSLVELQRAVAHALGRFWLGVQPAPGPALFVDAEDDANVLHIRLAAILKYYGATFADAVKGGLHLISLVGHDAVLGAPTRNGRIEPTTLYKQLLEAASDIKPKSITIASSADVFAGNELDRSQARQFVGLLTKIAIAANGTAALIAHPSLTGINTGTGLSGSTGWHNSVRARAYMTGIKPSENGEQPDTDLRQIIFKKNNYGPIVDDVVLRFQNGLFVPEIGVDLNRAARKARAEEVFLELLHRLRTENRFVGSSKSTIYAPAVFAKEDAAKKAKLHTGDFVTAMVRLFDAKKIWNEPYGKPSRPSYRIAPGEKTG